MKLNPDDIKILDDKEPLDLFTQSTKSARTLYVYRCKLRQILCEYMEDVLSGTFEETVAEHTARLGPQRTCVDARL